LRFCFKAWLNCVKYVIVNRIHDLQIDHTRNFGVSQATKLILDKQCNSANTATVLNTAMLKQTLFLQLVFHCALKTHFLEYKLCFIHNVIKACLLLFLHTIYL